jgi:hypothetical protein
MGRRQRSGTCEEERKWRVGRDGQLFCARKEYCVGLVRRQPERERGTGMYVQLAFSARIRIRDYDREGAGEVRVVAYVSNSRTRAH